MDEIIRNTIQSNLSLIKILIRLMIGYLTFVFVCLISFYNTRQKFVFENSENKIDGKTRKHLSFLEKTEKILLISSRCVAIPMLIFLFPLIIANYFKF